jgi:hypothetical protein
MSFKSPTQPLCLNCKGKIRKYTDPRTWVRDKVYRSLADVQRDNNAQVVHIRYDTVREGTSVWLNAIEAGAKIGEQIVSDYSTWDGESYEDEFFCGGPCRNRFAYSIARKYFTRRK